MARTRIDWDYDDGERDLAYIPQVCNSERARRFEALRAELAGEPEVKKKLKIRLILNKAEEALIAFSLSAWPFMFTVLLIGWIRQQLGW